MVPYLGKGSWSGVFIFLMYWAFGYYVNPFWYLFPQTWFGTQNEGASYFLYGINIFWSAIMVIGIMSFVYSRRVLMRDANT